MKKPFILSQNRYGWYRFVQPFLVLLFLVQFIPVCVHAQPHTEYIVKHFTSENGLAQNSVNDLALDNNGFLWIATQGGLTRYDGNTFRLYSNSKGISLVGRISRVTALQNGSVHIKAASDMDKFYPIYSNGPSGHDSLFTHASYKFYGIQNEPVILDGLLTGLDEKVYRSRLDKIRHITTEPGNISVNDHQLYYYINNKLEWLDTKERVMRNCGNLSRFSHNTICGDLFIGFDSVLSCVILKDGRRQEIGKATQHFRHLLSHIKGGQRLTIYKNNRTGCLFNYGNEVWNITNENGLLDATLLFSDIDFGQINTTMLYDKKSGTLFIGTFTTGLFAVKKNEFQTLIFDDKNVGRNNIYSQILIGNGDVLNQYVTYNPVTKKSKPLKNQLANTAFFYSSDHHIWYSDTTHMIASDTLLQHAERIPFPDKMENTIVGSFIEDESQAIWFATYNSLGYIKNQQIHFVIKNDPYFLKYKINQIFAYNRDTLWIAHGNGITAYDKKNNRISRIIKLPGNNVRNIYKAKDGSIWIGTYGQGFYKYQKHQFVAMPTDANRYLLFAHSFNEDNNGFFWIPTNNGLFQCQKEELDNYALHPGKASVYYYYHKNTGRYTNEYNGGTMPASVFYKNSLLLPTLNGVVSFVPDDTKLTLPNNNILIEHIICDEHIISSGNHFSLAPDFGRLRFTVSAPYMGDAVNNILEYNLFENGAAWYPLDNSGTIIYNRLPKGTYHLSIRKRIGFGINNYVYRNVAFTVQPYWYQTIGFIVLTILIGITAVYYVARLRLGALERSKRMLEKMVNDRTTELNDTITELHVSEQHLSQINGVHEKAIAMILHDIQSPLHYLSTHARYFNKHLQKLSPEEIAAYSRSLAQSSDKINTFANELLQWLIFNKGSQSLQYETVNVPELLKEIKSLYLEIMELNGNSLIIETYEPATIITDRNKLKLLIRNLVDNANKNCNNGIITMAVQHDQRDENIIISVADTGIGMTEKEVFELQNAKPEKGATFQKNKLGFGMVQDFLKLVDGSLSIQSKKGAGTTVSILLKKNNQLPVNTDSHLN